MRRGSSLESLSMSIHNLAPRTPGVTARMRACRSRDTAPERALRSVLHRSGLRYRVHARPEHGIPRRADIVFRRERVAVFVDGCFWHACSQHKSAPAWNAEYWRAKLLRNVARDRDTDERLRNVGWSVLRIWEHEALRDGVALVLDALGRRRKSGCWSRALRLCAGGSTLARNVKATRPCRGGGVSRSGGSRLAETLD